MKFSDRKRKSDLSIQVTAGAGLKVYIYTKKLLVFGKTTYIKQNYLSYICILKSSVQK